MAVQRLTAAYRSRPRPSSTPGAKASTACSYYLDGELPAPPLDVSEELRDFFTLGLVQFSRSTEATRRGSPVRGLSKLSSAAGWVSGQADACPFQPAWPGRRF